VQDRVWYKKTKGVSFCKESKNLNQKGAALLLARLLDFSKHNLVMDLAEVKRMFHYYLINLLTNPFLDNIFSNVKGIPHYRR